MPSTAMACANLTDGHNEARTERCHTRRLRPRPRPHPRPTTCGFLQQLHMTRSWLGVSCIVSYRSTQPPARWHMHDMCWAHLWSISTSTVLMDHHAVVDHHAVMDRHADICVTPDGNSPHLPPQIAHDKILHTFIHIPFRQYHSCSPGNECSPSAYTLHCDLHVFQRVPHHKVYEAALSIRTRCR